MLLWLLAVLVPVLVCAHCLCLYFVFMLYFSCGSVCFAFVFCVSRSIYIGVTAKMFISNLVRGRIRGEEVRVEERERTG